MCTTFVLKEKGTAILGESYDFYYGHGIIITNKKGAVKESLLLDDKRKLVTDKKRVLRWTSKFGSVTFNQFARELPISGMNEHGLAVAQMNRIDGAMNSEGKRAVNELQWMQYQLDNFKSTREVVRHVDDLGIIVSFLPLQYTVCDSKGDSAIVEVDDTGLKAHLNPKIHALTNTGYKESLEYAASIDESDVPSSMSPFDRFARTYFAVKDFKGKQTKDATGYAFSMLDDVRSDMNISSLLNYIIKRIPPAASYWNVVFDCVNRVVYFRTINAPSIRHFAIDSFDYSKSTPVKVLDINANLSGSVDNAFREYSTKDNEDIIRKSFAPIKDKFPKEIQDMLVRYPDAMEKLGSTHRK